MAELLLLFVARLTVHCDDMAALLNGVEDEKAARDDLDFEQNCFLMIQLHFLYVLALKRYPTALDGTTGETVLRTVE